MEISWFDFPREPSYRGVKVKSFADTFDIVGIGTYTIPEVNWFAERSLEAALLHRCALRVGAEHDEGVGVCGARCW